MLGEKMVQILKVPKMDEWADIWNKFHIQTGHSGFDTTWATISQYYYYPGLSLKVKQDVKTCMCAGT